MAQKEHALARFYKTKFVGSRKTWSAKLPVDVKGEGGRGSDLNVQWALSGGTFEYVDGPLCNFFLYERSARTQNSSAHDYSTIASIYELGAAHKRKPQETNKVRKLIIAILFVIPFLDYCGLPMLAVNLFRQCLLFRLLHDFCTDSPKKCDNFY